jgi:hypothetical protein
MGGLPCSPRNGAAPTQGALPASERDFSLTRELEQTAEEGRKRKSRRTCQTLVSVPLQCGDRATEGEFKSLALSQEILPAIGIVGVMGWKPKDHARLLPAMESITWSGRTVYLISDSDFSTNENVRNAFCWLGKHLTDRGAKVLLVSLPDGPADADVKPTKLGINDWLAIQTDRKAALRKLLDSAEPPPPVDAEAVKKPACSIDPAPEAAKFLKSLEKDG